MMRNKLKCLIIEDEPLASEILEDYIAQTPFLELSATSSNAMQGLDFLQSNQVDLIFLDIHLPGLKGLDFLKTLSNPPAVILTTAYHEYALQGYELNVIDYLLKPIEFKRFLEAVQKVSVRKTESKNEILVLQSEGKKVIINLSEIIYIESQKEYIKVKTTNGAYLSKYALTKLEGELNKNKFIRVHRSFIISIDKIKAFSQQAIDLPDISIPIGSLYRESVMNTLKSFYQ